MADPTALERAVTAWIADEASEPDAAQLRALLEAGDWEELADRFSGPLAFGTAGLRGRMRAGPNGMNRSVVRRSAAGLCAWLHSAGSGGATVVIGYDGRHGSVDFAHDCAGIFAASGFRALLLPGPLPTPVLAYAVRECRAALGMMVTASHNPAQDNGCKVYAADGAQITSPTDTEIEAAIRSVGSTRGIELSDAYTVLDDSLTASYVAAIAALAPAGARELRVVHTAMHGVGTATFAAVLSAAGFATPHSVPEQAEPDPDFPTVAFPNPEEPGALELALGLAARLDADVVIANDPDADRCAVAVPGPQGWRRLTGDEVGVLLADARIRAGVAGTYATTIVSSSLLSALCARAGVGYAQTLTGFKWLSRAADDLVYAYEEALGYAVAPGVVRDKDGISAGLLACSLAAALKATGSSLTARLAEIYGKFGLYATDQLSYRVADLSLITAAMARLRAAPPAVLLGSSVTYDDLLPATDGVRLRWTSGRVVVRPSGTEPKLKAYLEVVVPSGDRSLAHTQLTQLREELSATLLL